MRLFYSGDLNIEHGGYFYSLKGFQWDYVSAVRVTPCSDAGGPDNCFWIECLTVNIRKGNDLDSILKTCGMNLEGLTRAQKRHALIDCHISYGAYDIEHSEMIQIGKSGPFAKPGAYDEFRADRFLRGNVSLRRYVRRIALSHCE